MSPRNLRIGITALIVTSLGFVTGCSGAAPAEPQSLTVKYVDGAQDHVETVDVAQLKCNRLGEILTLESPEVKVTVSNTTGSAMAVITLSEGLSFVSTEKFSEEDGTLSFTELPGLVAEVDDSGNISSTVFDGATLSGTLTCS